MVSELQLRIKCTNSCYNSFCEKDCLKDRLKEAKGVINHSKNKQKDLQLHPYTEKTNHKIWQRITLYLIGNIKFNFSLDL